VATNVNFRAIQAVSGKVVWASASRGTVRRTLDSGATWFGRDVPGAEKLDFRGLAAFDERTAVVVSAGLAEEGSARAYRTTDGGGSWQEVFATSQSGVFLDGVAFWDTTNGLIFGDVVEGKWYLLKTADGGKSWQRVPPGALPAMLPGEAGAFAASNSAMVTQGASNVWLVSNGAGHARVFHSTDRGVTWRVTRTPLVSMESSGVFGLRFWDARHGIAVGGDMKQPGASLDNACVTSDGGATWEIATIKTPPGWKESAVLLPGNTLLVVGPTGTSLSRDFGRSWAEVDRRPLHALASHGGDCWAAGQAMIAKWKPGPNP
jgi:photosystem II stability/assembly factor-like uncharacterized protein